MYLNGLGDTASVASLVQSLAPSYGVPSSIALSLARAESSLNPSAVSPKGAIGVMQLMPATASDLGVNPWDETENVKGGLQYLANQYARFGNWTQALEAYNAGPAGNLAGSAGYASGILNAAGWSDTAPAAVGFDLAALPGDSSVTPDGSGVALGGMAWAALGVAALGTLVWAVSS